MTRCTCRSWARPPALTKLLALSENYCDLGSVLPTARALREQVDRASARRQTKDSPYAAAFFFLAERLGVIEPPTDAA